MATLYRDISRAAYVMAADATPLTADYRALAFPEHWHRSVLALCNRGPPEAEPYRTVPTYRMDGVLQSLAPDLIVRGRPPRGTAGRRLLAVCPRITAQPAPR